MSNREKAIALINAYYDGKDIEVKDPGAGIKDWTSIHCEHIWTFMGEFLSKLDKYRIK